MQLSIFKVALLGVVGLIGFQIPKIQTFIEEQNKYLERVSVYSPDLSDLKQQRIEQLENSEEPFEILDPETGALKHAGYTLRDKGLIFNRAAVKHNPNNALALELTKFRHTIMIFTFTENMISFQRLYDFNLNCFGLLGHLIKGKKEGHIMHQMPYDMFDKNLMGITYADLESISIKPFNFTADNELFELTPKEGFDKEKYDMVYNLKEHNTHPFNY